MLGCLESNETKPNLIPALCKQMLTSLIVYTRWDVQVLCPENECYPCKSLLKLNKVLVGCSLRIILN